ncbi:MAG: hypothetical protein ABL884_07640 [Methyloglobulus sp.]
MTEDQTNNSDLSAGEISQEQKFLGEILLMEASQKSKFKNFSFYGSWILSFIFFLTVVIFSWSIMFCPNIFITPK